jgi:hypothetical protein
MMKIEHKASPDDSQGKTLADSPTCEYPALHGAEEVSLRGAMVLLSLINHSSLPIGKLPNAMFIAVGRHIGRNNIS